MDVVIVKLNKYILQSVGHKIVPEGILSGRQNKKQITDRNHQMCVMNQNILSIFRIWGDQEETVNYVLSCFLLHE